MSRQVPVIAFVERFERERDLLNQIIGTVKSGGAENIIECYGLFLQFMSHLARESGNRPQAEAALPKPSTEQYVERAKDFIRENISRDITTSDVAAHLGLNRSYFYKISPSLRQGAVPLHHWQRLNTAWHRSTTPTCSSPKFPACGLQRPRLLHPLLHRLLRLSRPTPSKRKQRLTA